MKHFFVFCYLVVTNFLLGMGSCADPKHLPGLLDAGADGSVDAQVSEMAGEDAGAMNGQSTEPGRVSLQSTGAELPPPGFPVIEHFQMKFQLLYSSGHPVTEVVEANTPQSPNYEFRFGYLPTLDSLPAIGVFSYPRDSSCRDQVPASLRGEFGEYGVSVYAYEGSSSGPMSITSGGLSSEGVVLSNLSNQRTNRLALGNIHSDIPQDCREPALFEFRGIAFLRQVTLGVHLPVTLDRCRAYCEAQTGAAPDCVTSCNMPMCQLSGSITIRFRYLDRAHWWQNMRFNSTGSIPSDSTPSISYDRTLNNAFIVQTPIVLSPSR